MVLVIDKSGSMGLKLQYPAERRQGVRGRHDGENSAGNNQIAVVSFSDYATEVIGLTDKTGKQTIKTESTASSLAAAPTGQIWPWPRAFWMPTPLKCPSSSSCSATASPPTAEGTAGVVSSSIPKVGGGDYGFRITEFNSKTIGSAQHRTEGRLWV